MYYPIRFHVAVSHTLGFPSGFLRNPTTNQNIKRKGRLRTVPGKEIMIDGRNVSIIKDVDDANIVIINDRRFRGLTREDWKLVEQYLKGYVSDCYEIIETSEAVYIGTDFPSEYSGSESRIALKGARKKAKALASQGIPELIKIAKSPRWEANHEEKHSRDAKFGWYRYDIRFGIPVYDDQTGILDRYNIFTAILLVKHSEDGNKYLHDITTIKKETSSPLEQ